MLDFGERNTSRPECVDRIARRGNAHTISSSHRMNAGSRLCGTNSPW